MLALSLGLAIAPAYPASAKAPRPPARIFVLMVWDGLRPDFVTAERTPNLFAMENEGVRFARHHSVYPTITMVNAASLATGASPGSTTILGDEVSLLPRLSARKIALAPGDSWANQPVNLENSVMLAALNGPKFFNGALLGSEALGQQVRRAGGYLAIIGKQGPTFTFDDSVTGDLAMGSSIATSNFIFVSDDLVAPPTLKSQLAPAPSRPARESVVYGTRDTYFAQVVTERALPQAKAAALGGHPALVVFWQHNPDATQHH
ncbi:MAG TPA: alkaline phosphatase family protein, partial [Candidatus Binataceae bacterium]|nr:alkaline phosphatase family protein [Candidatus Binataceae bacterium]